MHATKPVWEELHGQLQSIAKRRAALDADEADCLVKAEAIGIWTRLGYAHMGEYMERELGYGPKAGMFETLVRRAHGAGTSDRPAYQIALTVCSACKRGWQRAGGHDVEVSTAAIECADCDAEHLGPIDADPPARTTTSVPPRTCKQVLARDKRCTVPGCRASANIDVHHIVRRADGGSHKASNLTVLCSGHHHQLHEGRMTMTGRAPAAIAFSWTTPPPDPLGDTLVEAEALSGLVNLGFRRDTARVAIARARAHVGRDATLDILMREALRRVPRAAAAA